MHWTLTQCRQGWRKSGAESRNISRKQKFVRNGPSPSQQNRMSIPDLLHHQMETSEHPKYPTQSPMTVLFSCFLIGMPRTIDTGKYIINGLNWCSKISNWVEAWTVVHPTRLHATSTASLCGPRTVWIFLESLYLGIRYEEHLRERVELRTGALWSPAALQRPPAADVAPRTCGTTARMEQTILPSTEANTMVRFYTLTTTWNRFYTKRTHVESFLSSVASRLLYMYGNLGKSVWILSWQPCYSYFIAML